MNEFLTSNEWPWRLAHTIVQGILGVVVANIDVLMGAAVLDPTWRDLRGAGDGGAVAGDGGARRARGAAGER